MPIVPTAQFYRGQAAGLEDVRERLLRRTSEASSRLRVQTTDDDPAAASFALETQNAQERLRSQLEGAAQLQTVYDSVDTQLTEATDVLARARATAIGGRTATQNARDRLIWGRQADALADQMFAVCNARLGRRYLFAGSLDNAAPFDNVGTYSGNAVVRRVEVGVGLTLPANLPGSQVFTVVGGQNVLQVLRTLATDLAAGQWDPVGTDLDLLDLAAQQISEQHTLWGILAQRLDAANARRERQLKSYQENLADLVEVNEFDSATQLRQVQTDYQRATQATASMLKVLELGL